MKGASLYEIVEITQSRVWKNLSILKIKKMIDEKAPPLPKDMET